MKCSRLKVKIVKYIGMNTIWNGIVILPYLEINIYIENLESVSQRAGKADIYSVIILPVTEAYYKCTFRELILSDTAVQDKLICCNLNSLRT